MGGMGTPQGPAGAEEIMASRNYTTVQTANCFLDFTTQRFKVRPLSGPGYDKWGRLLDANSAGTAESAEEFTKQFMSQLTGNTAGNLPPPL